MIESSSNRILPADESDEDHDDGDHEKYVNEPSERVRAHEAEEPENEKQYRDSVEHVWVVLLIKREA